MYHHNSFQQTVPEGYFPSNFRVFDGRLHMGIHQVGSNEMNHIGNGNAQHNFTFPPEDMYYPGQQHFSHGVPHMSSVGSFDHEYASECSHGSISPQQPIQAQQTNLTPSPNASAYSGSGSVMQNGTPSPPNPPTPPQYSAAGGQPFPRLYPLVSEVSPHQRTQQQMPPNSRSGAARSPFEWIRRPTYQTQPNPGKTRTKDKYRVVYSDHQRLELEKEYHLNTKYINIKRKAEIAADLCLSERQVKIWFQNRRAKDRKLEKKQKEEERRALESHADRDIPDGAGALREVSFNIAMLNENGIHQTNF